MTILEKDKNYIEILHDKKIYLASYDSIVAIYEKINNELTLGKNWDYSNSTLKHVYKFINNNCYDIYDNDGIVRINWLLQDTNNKKKLINSLINNGVIKYDKEVL